MYRGNMRATVDECCAMLSGGRANHRDGGLANCAFTCVERLVAGGGVPCLPTLLRAERDIREGEEITVSYGAGYALQDLSKWAQSDRFSLIVGRCRGVGMDVVSAFGAYTWSEQSTFYCQRWDEEGKGPESLVEVTNEVVGSWEAAQVKQVFVVAQGESVFGCSVHDLDCASRGEGTAVVYRRGGSHHVLLESAQLGSLEC